MAECLHYRYGNVVKKRSATAAGLDVRYPNKSGEANPGSLNIFYNQQQCGK